MVKSKFRITLDLNLIHHLGINLYSNIPAVLSEAVANAWDADAPEVRIELDNEKGEIIITDNGTGMSVEDINNKYLVIGYQKRRFEGDKTKKGRLVMGRKGIGKLSLFSIAKKIYVMSVSGPEEEKSGLILDVDKIEHVISTRDPNLDKTYYPEEIDEHLIDINQGTKIVLTDLTKKSLVNVERYLRRRLARRFSVIGEDFRVLVNNEEITYEDRDYLNKLQYIWYFGDKGKEILGKLNLPEIDYEEEISDKVDPRLEGWIGTVESQKDLIIDSAVKSDSNNSIIVLARGKLAEEDMLRHLNAAGIASAYIIGEVHADFIDKTENPDIITTDRQKINEASEYFEVLQVELQKIINLIQNKWTDLRNETAIKKINNYPSLDEWYSGLNDDNKNIAKKMLGQIETLGIEDPSKKVDLYTYGMFAFQSLQYRGKLNLLENTSYDIDTLINVFKDIDEIERVQYANIIRRRIEVLIQFENMCDDNELEKKIQEHLFNHLWLIDPSWERATILDKEKERTVKNFLKHKDVIDEDLLKSRFDIQVCDTANRWTIVELKRYDRQLVIPELTEQIRKYKNAMAEVMRQTQNKNKFEILLIIGRKPQSIKNEEWQDFEKMIDTLNARLITFDKLIDKAKSRYSEYLEKQKDITDFQKLVSQIEKEILEAG